MTPKHFQCTKHWIYKYKILEQKLGDIFRQESRQDIFLFVTRALFLVLVINAKGTQFQKQISEGIVSMSQPKINGFSSSVM
jgi:hypothetical protein